MVKGSDVLLIFVAILFPPAAAAFITGCSCDLLINILLTILGYIPGHIHAFWLIYKKMKAEEALRPRRLPLYVHLHVGNGTYEPIAQGQPQQPYYGATN
ncbi:UPF0057-domain-containing protein [Mycena sanguinolenta]|uniref:UPF0057-domain-containing protein n=1 Tax=Mycena sanguinolenta TaxID=230812 RepID=A0A8H7CUZ2_9AGAR|nr:UPF0057-domain-containing protein [Mycena sanguinolenta]